MHIVLEVNPEVSTNPERWKIVRLIALALHKESERRQDEEGVVTVTVRNSQRRDNEWGQPLSLFFDWKDMLEQERASRPQSAKLYRKGKLGRAQYGELSSPRGEFMMDLGGTIDWVIKVLLDGQFEVHHP